MVTARLNGNFFGTLHHKGEPGGRCGCPSCSTPARRLAVDGWPLPDGHVRQLAWGDPRAFP